jgi:hypothetical protein
MFTHVLFQVNRTRTSRATPLVSVYVNAPDSKSTTKNLCQVTPLAASHLVVVAMNGVLAAQSYTVFTSWDVVHVLFTNELFERNQE